MVMLLFCVAMEFINHGFGIAAALKALTLFYVGGASGASRLLTCQRVGGDQTNLPETLMFRKWLPHLRCYDSSLDYLDAIGYASSFFYGVGVPCALAYLYTRQHLALLPGKTMVASASEDENLELRLSMVKVSSQEKVQSTLPGVCSRRQHPTLPYG